ISPLLWSGSTPDPEPSPPSPRCAEPTSEPTTDGEPKRAATDELSPTGATELRIAPEQGRPWPICCPRQDFTWRPLLHSPFHQ
ncbi:hypothetical protein M9458_048392, partial [Cirrhinus mrigala]